MKPRKMREESEPRDLLAEINEGVNQMLAGAKMSTRVVEVSAAVHVLRISGLSQEELATQLGVTKRTFHNWVRGHRQPTKPARLLLGILAKHPELITELQSPTKSDSSRKTSKRSPRHELGDPPTKIALGPTDWKWLMELKNRPPRRLEWLVRARTRAQNGLKDST
jgi:putative transcriptional regulator